ncbi:Protein TANC2 [Dirofilaria immitis]
MLYLIDILIFYRCYTHLISFDLNKWQGRDALISGFPRSHMDVVDLSLSISANGKISDRLGCTALDIANEKGIILLWNF